MKYAEDTISYRVCKACGARYAFFATVDKDWKKQFCDEHCRDRPRSVKRKVLCTGHPACGFDDCPHATAHDPYTFGGTDGDGVTCENEGPCEQWQQRPGIGPQKSRCRCVAVQDETVVCFKVKQEMLDNIAYNVVQLVVYN